MKGLCHDKNPAGGRQQVPATGDGARAGPCGLRGRFGGRRRTGVTTAREKLPDLILLDMLLPKMSGPDVLRALKSDMVTASIPVVVLTGLSQKNAERLQEDGADGFLEKSALGLDQGAEALLVAVRDFVQRLCRKRAAQAGSMR
jgi:CheY-like chemotaxis protein